MNRTNEERERESVTNKTSKQKKKKEGKKRSTAYYSNIIWHPKFIDFKLQAENNRCLHKHTREYYKYRFVAIQKSKLYQTQMKSPNCKSIKMNRIEKN